MTFSIDNPRGVATTPLRKICLGKTLRRTRVKKKKKKNLQYLIPWYHDRLGLSHFNITLGVEICHAHDNTKSIPPSSGVHEGGKEGAWPTFVSHLKYFFRPFYVQYRKRYCTHPLALPRSGDGASASHFRSRRCTTFGAFPQAGTGTEIITKCPLAGMQYFWLHFGKRNCRFWIVFLWGGNVNFYVYLRSRGPWTEIITKSPLAGM